MKATPREKEGREAGRSKENSKRFQRFAPQVLFKHQKLSHHPKDLLLGTPNLFFNTLIKRIKIACSLTSSNPHLLFSKITFTVTWKLKIILVAHEKGSMLLLTSICWTVRSRKVFSFLTPIRLFGPLQPMLVPKPPLSFTTTSLFSTEDTLSGKPLAFIFS